MTQPFYIPPKLFGEIMLPETVQRVAVSLPKEGPATVIQIDFSSNQGAYGQTLHLRAKNPIQWIQKEGPAQK